MHEEKLAAIGLTRNESHIYTTLLQLGPSLVGAIAKKTHVNRTNIYDLLKRLIDKGLVAHVVKSGRKYFYAIEPKMLLRYLEEQRQKIDKAESTINEILPDLEALRKLPSSESVQVYEGKEGLKTVLEDILKTKATVYTYGTENNFSGVLQFYFKHYLTRFEKLGVRMYVVFSNAKRPFVWKFARTRYISQKYASPTETTIYGDNVAIFVFTAEPRAVVIKSKSVAVAYRKYFNILWNSAKDKP